MRIICVKFLKQYVELPEYNTPISCNCQVFMNNIVYIVSYFQLTFEIIVL